MAESAAASRGKELKIEETDSDEEIFTQLYRLNEPTEPTDRIDEIAEQQRREEIDKREIENHTRQQAEQYFRDREDEQRILTEVNRVKEQIELQLHQGAAQSQQNPIIETPQSTVDYDRYLTDLRQVNRAKETIEAELYRQEIENITPDYSRFIPDISESTISKLPKANRSSKRAKESTPKTIDASTSEEEKLKRFRTEFRSNSLPDLSASESLPDLSLSIPIDLPETRVIEDLTPSSEEEIPINLTEQQKKLLGNKPVIQKAKNKKTKKHARLTSIQATRSFFKKKQEARRQKDVIQQRGNYERLVQLQNRQNFLTENLVRVQEETEKRSLAFKANKDTSKEENLLKQLHHAERQVASLNSELKQTKTAYQEEFKRINLWKHARKEQDRGSRKKLEKSLKDKTKAHEYTKERLNQLRLNETQRNLQQEENQRQERQRTIEQLSQIQQEADDHKEEKEEYKKVIQTLLEQQHTAENQKNQLQQQLAQLKTSANVEVHTLENENQQLKKHLDNLSKQKAENIQQAQRITDLTLQTEQQQRQYQQEEERRRELELQYQQQQQELERVNNLVGNLQNNLKICEENIKKEKSEIAMAKSSGFDFGFDFETFNTPTNKETDKAVSWKQKIESNTDYFNSYEEPMRKSTRNHDASALQVLKIRNVDIASLPKFGGDITDDIIEYFQKLELLLALYDLNNRQKANVIPLTLKNRPYSYYQTLTTATKEDYNKLKTALITEFNAPELLYADIIKK